MGDRKTGQSNGAVVPVTRVYLGESLSLATLAPVIEHLRSAFECAEEVVEIDSRDIVSMTEAASLLLAAEMDRAARSGVRFQMAA